MTETRPKPKLISLVIPLYNEEKVFSILRARLYQFALAINLPVEFLLVNDGSKDQTPALIRQWCREDSRVKFVDLSRNFGQQAAMTAGLDFTSGDAVVIMDGDLQDPPELISEMVDEYCLGFDVVYAQRIRRRNETFFKLATARGFYFIMKHFVYKDLPENTGDFRLMSRAVVDALSQLREGHRFLRGMVAWMGFRQTSIQFERPERPAGETKFPVRKMVRFAWHAILSFSSIPLRVSAMVGTTVLVGGLIFGGWAVYRKIFYDDLVQGWPTLVVLNCVIGGTILVCLGVMGEYIGKIFEEIKQRPIYIVRDLVNIAPGEVLRRGIAPRASINSYPLTEPSHPDRPLSV